MMLESKHEETNPWSDSSMNGWAPASTNFWNSTRDFTTMATNNNNNNNRAAPPKHLNSSLIDTSRSNLPSSMRIQNVGGEEDDSSLP